MKKKMGAETLFCGQKVHFESPCPVTRDSILLMRRLSYNEDKNIITSLTTAKTVGRSFHSLNSFNL